MSSYRPPPNLCHEGYIYNIYSTNRTSLQKWRCGRRKQYCKGRVAVHSDGLTEVEHEHNHSPEPPERIEKANRRIQKLHSPSRPIVSDEDTAVSVCFLCRLKLLNAEEEGNGTSFQPDTDEHGSCSDSFSVLHILVDMYDYRIPPEIALSLSEKRINFCVRCANSIIKWNGVLKQIADLQNQMEDHFKQMESLRQSVEEIFKESNSKRDSLQSKLCDYLGLKTKKKRGRPRTAERVQVTVKKSRASRSNARLKKLIPVKVEVLGSLDSDIENGTVELLQSQKRGRLRKLPSKTYNDESSKVPESSTEEDEGIPNRQPHSDLEDRSSDAIEESLQAEEIVTSVSQNAKRSKEEVADIIEGHIKRRRQRCKNSASRADQRKNRLESSNTATMSVIDKDQENVVETSDGQPKPKRSRTPRQSVYEQDLRVDTAPDGRIFIRTIHIQQNEGKYKCAKCRDESYDTLDDVKDHLRAVHEETLQKYRWLRFRAPKKTYLKKQKTKEDGSIWYDAIEILRVGDYFQCSVCRNVLYTTKDSVHTHVRSKHGGDKSCECSLCGRKLINTASLKIHMKTHVSTKAYICEICGRSFKSDQSLRGHRRLVHNRELQLSTRFTCEYCGKQFAFRRDCIVHTRSHTSEKPFSCELCDQSFKVRALLNRHLRDKHGKDLVYKCKHCDQVFTNLSDFCSHVATHFPEKQATETPMETSQLTEIPTPVNQDVPQVLPVTYDV